VVNIDTQQSLAVRSQRHVPLVFDDPQKFIRTGFADEKDVLSTNRNQFISNNLHLNSFNCGPTINRQHEVVLLMLDALRQP